MNRSTDTFESIVDRINQAGAGVTAAYDGATDRLTITPTTPGATLTLTDDTSGFLAAVNAVDWQYGARTPTRLEGVQREGCVRARYSIRRSPWALGASR